MKISDKKGIFVKSPHWSHRHVNYHFSEFKIGAKGTNFNQVSKINFCDPKLTDLSARFIIKLGKFALACPIFGY